MVIYEDTRNKLGSHEIKNKYFKEHGITVVRKKLDYGDYMLEGQPNISVDTKQDLNELSNDMFHQKTRFEKELRNAHLKGIKLYILVEQRVPNKETLLKWLPPKTVDGKRLSIVGGKDIYKKMKEHALYYETAYRFCRKVDSGKKIIEILTKKK